MTEVEKTDISRPEVMRVILEISKKLAKDKVGALFILSDRAKLRGNFVQHYPQIKFTGSLLDKGMDAVIEKLASLDGAVILTQEGELVAYGSRVLKSETMLGFGTRHAAAKGFTSYDQAATAVLVSEESGWIKVFQKGNIVLETDSVDIEPSTLEKVASFLMNHDTALLVGAGISVATLSVPATAVLIVGGTYMVVKNAFTMISAALKREHPASREKK
ncbi:MAG TPA: hypothetical protein HA257_03985 [Candidatus Methanoperedenaceae archaeon]|nr:hypothetical protein [Candidatus Methanoperedenaceae archaeon]